MEGIESPMRSRLLVTSLLLAALSGASALGCSSAQEEPPPPSAEATAGDEEVAPEVPTGPPQSYVADDYTVVMRLDMERVRASSLAGEIGAQVRSYETWRELLGASGIDPIRDFDRVIATAPTSVVGESILFVRHHLGRAGIRDAVLRMSVDRGQRPEWREVDGFEVVDWPADTDPPRIVVLTSESELVMTTPGLLERAIAVAHDHRLRREADEAIEPALALEELTIATVAVSELTERTRSRIQHPPRSLDVELSDDATEQGRVHLHGSGRYDDAASAEAARAYFSEQRDFYAGQMLVRAVGLDGPLRDAEITAEGDVLEVRASFTEEEIQRVFGLLAAMQQFTQ